MKGRGHLGKGIHALIPTVSEDQAQQGIDSVMEIDVGLIEANPFQPRLIFGEESFEELKRSIEEKGVIQPVLIRPMDNGKYQLVAGERRLRATIDLGIREIPAYVKQIDSDEEMLEIAIIENVQREQLNPIDLALGYQQLIDECGLTQEDVARKIGKDRTTVANQIRLLKLPEKIRKSVSLGELKEGHARALLGIQNKTDLDRIWKKAVKESLSVRNVEKLARAASNKNNTPAEKNRSGRRPAYVTKLETNLREKLGTQVKVRTRKGGGTIEVMFYSNEDLDRLMDIFDQIKY